MLLQELDGSVTDTSWNFSGQRMVAVAARGTILQIWDTVGANDHESSSGGQLRLSFQWKVDVGGSVMKAVWAPPEYGDLVASASTDGSIFLWEEVVDGEETKWRTCALLQDSHSLVLDLQFGNPSTGLRLVAFHADGNARVYETSDPLNLTKWQLQAEFQNVKNVAEKMMKCSYFGASICWRGPVFSTTQPAFVLGCDSSSDSVNSAKIWEFEQSRQRWFCMAELKEADEEKCPVNHVAWAPNIGRLFEMIAVASGNGVSIWQVQFSAAEHEKVSTKRVARLSAFVKEVLQVAWDMSGMTLAVSASDGSVSLWQENLKGEWQQCVQIEDS